MKRFYKTQSFVSLLVALGLLLTACAAPTPAVQPTATPSEMDLLIAAAQAEGALTVMALDRTWCNYGTVIDTFRAKYGIVVTDLNPSAGSGDELDAVRAVKADPNAPAPDVLDVGFAFGAIAKDEGLIVPYRVSTWDTIPAEMKDPAGYWYGDYFGVLAFLVNTDIQPNPPQDWADLLKPEYKGQVALSGDPRASSQAIQTVFAAALAEGNGGSLDNAMPGLDFFAKLNASGNLLPYIANNDTVASGLTPIRITWDYNAQGAIDSYGGSPSTALVIPKSGRLAGVYVQAISAYAKHPNAAKLWMEFVYSDEGQLLWMKGYCHPIRESDLRARSLAPASLTLKMPDVSGAVLPTVEQLDAANEVITKNWDALVGLDIQRP